MSDKLHYVNFSQWAVIHKQRLYIGVGRGPDRLPVFEYVLYILHMHTPIESHTHMSKHQISNHWYSPDFWRGVWGVVVVCAVVYVIWFR